MMTPSARHTLLPKLLLRIVLDLLYTNSFGAQTLLPALPYLFSCVCRECPPSVKRPMAKLCNGPSVLYGTPHDRSREDIQCTVLQPAWLLKSPSKRGNEVALNFNLAIVQVAIAVMPIASQL